MHVSIDSIGDLTIEIGHLEHETICNYLAPRTEEGYLITQPAYDELIETIQLWLYKIILSKIEKTIDSLKEKESYDAETEEEEREYWVEQDGD